MFFLGASARHRHQVYMPLEPSLVRSLTVVYPRAGSLPLVNDDAGNRTTVLVAE